MPRRIPDYPLQFTDFNQIASYGAFVFGIAQLLFAYILIDAIIWGKKADKQVWEGAKGLEWTLDSPPEYHTFMTPPDVEKIQNEQAY